MQTKCVTFVKIDGKGRLMENNRAYNINYKQYVSILIEYLDPGYTTEFAQTEAFDFVPTFGIYKNELRKETVVTLSF